TKAAATQAARSEVAQTLLSIQAQSANRPKSARLNYGYYALKTLWEELRLPAKIRYLQAKTRIHTDLLNFLVKSTLASGLYSKSI
ncbi:MAG: hypothetical protein Q4E62_09370, partial [Sutterellaceae bacterium]|nr:hypothetical protein [Sutterellaceae bacterium]